MNKIDNIAYLFLNGDLLGDTGYFSNFIKKNPGDLFCADGGFKHCQNLNLTPCEIWGDLDSISDSDLKFIEMSNIPTKRFPREKDFTDGELILEYLSHKNYQKIYIIGGLGGRTSHTLTNLSLIVKYKNIIFLTETEEIFFVTPLHMFSGLKGVTISFIPYSSEVTNLTLSGFKFPLNSYTLKLGSSICMSNIVISDNTVLTYDTGSLIGIIEKI